MTLCNLKLETENLSDMYVTRRAQFVLERLSKRRKGAASLDPNRRNLTRCDRLTADILSASTREIALIFRRLPAKKAAMVIELLIDELDRREGDPDFERNEDAEPDADNEDDPDREHNGDTEPDETDEDDPAVGDAPRSGVFDDDRVTNTAWAA